MCGIEFPGNPGAVIAENLVGLITVIQTLLPETLHERHQSPSQPRSSRSRGERPQARDFVGDLDQTGGAASIGSGVDRQVGALHGPPDDA